MFIVYCLFSVYLLFTVFILLIGDVSCVCAEHSTMAVTPDVETSEQVCGIILRVCGVADERTDGRHANSRVKKLQCRQCTRI